MPLTPASAISSAVFNSGNGRYYQAALLDKVFMGGTLKAGVTLPTMAATLATTFTLWNPAGSGVVCEPIEFGWGATSATFVVNSIAYALLFNVSQLSTGVPTSPTFAAGAAQSTGGVANGGISTTGRSTPKCGLYSALTLTNAAVFGPLVNMFSMGATTGTNFSPMSYEFDGKVAMPPDTLITFVAGTGAYAGSGASLVWAEW